MASWGEYVQASASLALRRRLQLVTVGHGDDAIANLRRQRRREERTALREWRKILERLTNERGAWGVGIEAATAFAARWVPLEVPPCDEPLKAGQAR